MIMYATIGILSACARARVCAFLIDTGFVERTLGRDGALGTAQWWTANVFG